MLKPLPLQPRPYICVYIHTLDYTHIDLAATSHKFVVMISVMFQENVYKIVHTLCMVLSNRLRSGAMNLEPQPKHAATQSIEKKT